MKLSDFTPITLSAYMLLNSPSWEGQTPVVDNHTWQCWKTQDGQLVRTQSQLVPDALLSAEKLLASNAAKHRFTVRFEHSEYQLDEWQLGTCMALMRQYQAGRADTGSDEEVYEAIIRQELGVNEPVNALFPELENLADMSGVIIS